MKKPKQPKKGANKLVLGFAAVAASAMVATTGMAAATTPTATANGYGGNTGIGGNLDLHLDLRHSSRNIVNVIVNIFRP